MSSSNHTFSEWLDWRGPAQSRPEVLVTTRLASGLTVAAAGDQLTNVLVTTRLASGLTGLIRQWVGQHVLVTTRLASGLTATSTG